MTNSAEGIGISFVRNADGLLLILDSPKWKLDRGKASTVQLVTGSQTVEAKGLAETKSVTIAITDRPFNAPAVPMSAGMNGVRLQPLSYLWRNVEGRGYTQQLAIETVDVRPRTVDPAQPRRMLHHGLKHCLQIERRPADDLEHLRSCRLLLPRLIQLAGEPRDLCFQAASGGSATTRGLWRFSML